MNYKVRIILFTGRNLTYWDVTRLINLTNTAEIFSANHTTDDISNGNEIVAER